MSPRRAPGLCSYPGCGELVTRPGRCERHRRQAWQEQNQRRRQDPDLRERYRFYGSAEWKAIRAQVLREEPWCRECLRLGRRSPSREVHHVNNDWRDSRRENLEARCRHCHSSATMAGLNRARDGEP